MPKQETRTRNKQNVLQLLRRFYNEMMIPNFPILDGTCRAVLVKLLYSLICSFTLELDPLEKWEYLLGDNPRRQTYAPDFHVLIVVQEEGVRHLILSHLLNTRQQHR